MRISVDWRLTLLVNALLWASMFAIAFAREPQSAGASEPFTMDDTLAAVDGAPEPIGCLVYHETWPHWDPYSVGAAGELGAAQLHPGGELPAFLHGDWTPLPPSERDPFNPDQAVAYLEWYGATHDGTYEPWSTWRLCA